MEVPSEQSVVGAFDGVTLSHGQEAFEFTRSDDRYVVRVTGPDGDTTILPIRYTFGVEPLQQYLVDVGGGRLQSLLVAWDARPAADGGQRWFHLQGDDVAPVGDPLHWDAPVFTWNHSCAACHSTGVDKGYDRQSGRYDTTFAEIDVGCEACHGQGSRHVAAARAGRREPMPFPLSKPDTRAWLPRPEHPIAALQGAAPDDPELDRCAPCHSHRSELSAEDGGMHDRSRIALLDEGLYFDDGQIRDEVFVMGSFLQSKMHAAGVVCSDCHEPHGLKLRVRGNALCGTCHRPEVFDTTEHHLHAPGTEGAQCTVCHMPQRTYMQVDDRADHRFGVPQPMLAAVVGASDPCQRCHPAQTPEQAADAIGPREPREPGSFGEALHSARRGEPGAASLLLGLVADARQPAIVRATALHELGRHSTPALVREVERASQDPDPLLRRTAAGLAELLPAPSRDRILGPLLRDASRSVRLEACGTLVGAGPRPPTRPISPQLQVTIDEYRQLQETSADRAHGLDNLALLARFEGDPPAARALLEEAIAIEPSYLAAHINLADLHRAAGRDADAEAVLRRALPLVDDKAAVQHALGLTLIRLERVPEAVSQLEAAHAARPDVARYGHVLAIALFDTGRPDDALTVLRAVYDRHPTDPGVLSTLADYSARQGRSEDAQRYRTELESLLDEPDRSR